MKLAITSVFVCTLILLAGCGGQFNSAMVAAEASASKGGYSKDKQGQAEVGGLLAGEDAGGPATASAIANRKIIYDTQIGLVVEDYTSFESQLPKLIEKFGGFVASSNTDRRYNNSQMGTWVVRLPVDQYGNFLTSVSSLGFAESRCENANDVTEEYVDLTARIKNKKQLETRVLEMLEQRKGPLKDVLAIESELSRIRETVERMEGRIRFLQDRTSLATVTISCREQKAYQPAEAPTLASRINDSWSGSIGALQRGAEDFLVGLIGATPWLVLIALAIGLLAIFTRKYWRIPALLRTQTN